MVLIILLLLWLYVTARGCRVSYTESYLTAFLLVLDHSPNGHAMLLIALHMNKVLYASAIAGYHNKYP